MKTTSIFVIFLLKGLLETTAMQVTGIMDREIKITCSHSNAYSNVKYFCKDPCGYQDILIKSNEEKKDSKRKYSITDEGNTFYVTISDLEKGDAGIYWCGIERVGADTHNKVILEVLDYDDERAHANSSFSQKLVYIGASLCVVVLVLGIALLIFFRHRNSNINTSSGSYNDVVYTPSIQKKDALHDKNTSRSKKDQETDWGTDSFSTNQHPDASEPLEQSDNLFYATVSFKNRTECSALPQSAPYSATPIYSTLKHKSAEDSVIYSNI